MLSLRPRTVALIYLAAGLAVYGMTLSIPLLSDDFYFLGLVAPAKSWTVVFEPLVGRFLRPAVVAVYYVSYHAMGVSPWLYHVLTVVPHLVTAWLIYLVTRHLDPDDPATPVLAGLLFVVFAGHSEAVSWAAGVADPLLGMPLVAALYCYVRGLDAEADAATRWIAGFFVALAGAPLVKEAWVMFPGLLVAHAVGFGLRPGPQRRRAAIMFGGAVLFVIAYLGMRTLMFGSVTGGYSGLAPDFHFRDWVAQARAFALRCFVPSGSLVANSWLNSRDLLLWPVALLVVALTARGRTLRMVVFTALAAGAALVPVLPFTISVSTTESERYIYLATVFTCPLMVWSIRGLIRTRAIVVTLCLGLAGAHAVKLIDTNRLWRSAGTFARDIIHSLADEVERLDPSGTSQVILLNLADNIGGPFVFRTGFYPALQLVRPALGARAPATVVVATQSFAHADDAVRVTRTGAGFDIDLGRNTFVQQTIPASFGFRITAQTRRSYSIAFDERIDRAVVLYVSNGRVRSAGVIEGEGRPFGSLDLPVAGAACEGASSRFAGWALDRDGVGEVRIEAIDSGVVIGRGEWKVGMRPDVAKLYPGYPDAARAGWDFELPCALVRAAGAAGLRVRVTAEDTRGRTGILGERELRAVAGVTGK